MEPGLEWRAIQWRDGSTYEGLVKDRRLHSHGVLRFPNKDRYEGQFTNGVFDGYGVYVWADGTIYRGEWMQGEMHGCGIKLWRDAGAAKSAAAAPPVAAAAAAASSSSSSPSSSSTRQPASVVVRAAEGRFARDMFAGPGLSPCEDPQSALDAAVEADYAATQARSFERGARLGAAAAAGPATAAKGQAQDPQRRGGLGWFGGLFGRGGGGGAKGDAAAATPPSATAAAAAAPSAPRPVLGGGAGPVSLQSMKPGDRELLSALVDRMMEHEIALAMEQQQQQQQQQRRR